MAKQKANVGVKAPKTVMREKVYPDYKTVTFKGEDSVTPDQAKEWIGWQEEGEGQDFGADYLFIFDGKKIRTTNNNNNRPFDETWARKLMQDMLHKRWKLNAQSIALGEYGNVVSGQHRLIALIMADVERTDPKRAAYWEAIWGDGPVSIETDVTFGVEESSDVSQTVDSTKTRTLSDVVYCNPDYFKKENRQDRKLLSKVLEFGVRNLWNRTGTPKERRKSFAPYLTHSEAMAFVDNHRRLERTASEIYNLDKETNDEDEKLLHIRQGTRLSYGECAALMYLMGAAASDGDEYHNMEVKSEKGISWELWDTAVDFWGKIATGSEDMQFLRDAMSSLFHVEAESTPTKLEKWACLINAWNLFKDGEELTIGGVKPSYADESKRQLNETPTVGGIDRVEEDEEEEVDEDDTEGLNPEEVAEAAQVEKEAALEASKDANRKKTREQLIKERQAALAAKRAQEATNGEDGPTEGEDDEPAHSEELDAPVEEEPVEEEETPKPQRSKKPKAIVRKQ
jgi:hypothetical protein